MTGRHARRSRIPLMVPLVIALAVAASITWAAIDDGGSGSPSRAGPVTGGASSAQRTPGPTGATADASPGGDRPATETDPAPPPKERIVIHGTGDVSLDPSYIPAFQTNGYGWAWTGLDGLFRRDDLTVINHECPSTDIVSPVPKEFSFRCDPAALPVAARHGVDVASLANNHGFDHGPEGLLDSIRNVRRAGILPVGAGANAEEADAPAYVDVKGWRIAIVAVGEVIDPLNQVATQDAPGTAVGHDFARALRAIREAEANADLVIVVIHWGVELDTQPREYQVEEGHRMVRAGADVIFGHHAHRLQPMETYRGRPIFWGLGNFVWPDFSFEGRVAVTP